jgi:hypothetical protein
MFTESQIVTAFATLSCLAWIFMFVAKKSRRLWLGNCFGIVYHIALAPVVHALPALEFVRMAGYFWIFADALIDVASINGMSEDNVWALRMGVHIPASIWIVGTSLWMPTLAQYLGMVLGVLLALHAVVGPRIPNSKFKLFIFVLPCMAAWLGLIAFNA